MIGQYLKTSEQIAKIFSSAYLEHFQPSQFHKHKITMSLHKFLIGALISISSQNCIIIEISSLGEKKYKLKIYLRKWQEAFTGEHLLGISIHEHTAHKS